MAVQEDTSGAPPPPSGDPPPESTLGGGISSLLTRHQAKKQKQKQKGKNSNGSTSADKDKHGGGHGHDLAYEIEVVRSPTPPSPRRTSADPPDWHELLDEQTAAAAATGGKSPNATSTAGGGSPSRLDRVRSGGLSLVRSFDSGTGGGGGHGSKKKNKHNDENNDDSSTANDAEKREKETDRPATIITTPVLLRQDSEDAVLSAMGNADGTEGGDGGAAAAGKSTYEMISPKAQRDGRRLGGRRCWIVTFLFVLVVAAVLLALYFTDVFGDGDNSQGSSSSMQSATNGGGEEAFADDFDGADVDDFGGPGTQTKAPTMLSPTTSAPTSAAPTSTPTAGPTFPPNPPRDYQADRCTPAESAISSTRHLYPTENAVVTRIAYGSCYKPEEQISSVLWEDVRNFRPDLFIWLGDNVYNAGRNMDSKRRAYNEGRDDLYYRLYGPVAEPKIPVTGTWDDNGFGEGEGLGNDYGCLASSQAEFVHHMSVPESDPRHPAQGMNQRFGVYGSHMFARPGPSADGNTNGIHVINLDARSHRSPTRRDRGLPCEGAFSTMLGDEQWAWLEKELMTKKSTIKVIASGTPILPPTTRERAPTELCAYDGPDGTFDAANEAVGEGTAFTGTSYEGWGEVPQERTRLLQLVQKSMNAGMAKRVIFMSGEQHWGELMAMKIPEDAGGDGGAAQVVYEVTASGIDQNWIEDIDNSHRVRVRTADSGGNGFYDKECNFPFVYEGVTYNDCADVFNTGIPVCATRTSSDNSVAGGQWGNCLPAEQELVPKERQRYSLENKCADSYHFTCSAQANYGTMVVDWNAETITLSIRTPHHNSPMASEITVDI